MEVVCGCVGAPGVLRAEAACGGQEATTAGAEAQEVSWRGGHPAESQPGAGPVLSQSLTPHLLTPRVGRLSPNEDCAPAGRGGPWPAVSVWHPAGTQHM